MSATGVLAPTTYYFPRSCIDRSKIVNADFNFVPYNGTQSASLCGNVYFSGYVSVNGDSSYPFNMTNASGVAGGGAISSNPRFPSLPNSTTPSVNVYMR